MTHQHRRKEVFVYPRLNRSGLGNLLVIWARAEVLAQRHGFRVLQPQWTQLKIGPLLRGERDLRYYTGLFQRKSFVGGLRKRWVLARHTRFPEADARDLERGRGGAGAVIEVHGLGNMFEPLLNHAEFLHRRLNQIAAKRVQEEVIAEPTDYDVACHVRRGDIPIMNQGEKVVPWKTNKALPDSWFLNALSSIEEKLGFEPRVRIFSDGTDEDLRLLLQRPLTKRALPKSALADILCLARAPAILTTGSSSFSTWGVLLGQQPAAWYPSLLQHVHPQAPELDVATDEDGFLSREHASVLCESISVARATRIHCDESGDGA